MNTVLSRLLVGFGVLGLAAIATAAVGCKQGTGERCQASSDCTSPLICNQATHTCAETSGGGLDASIPDAPADAPHD